MMPQELEQIAQSGGVQMCLFSPYQPAFDCVNASAVETGQPGAPDQRLRGIAPFCSSGDGLLADRRRQCERKNQIARVCLTSYTGILPEKCAAERNRRTGDVLAEASASQTASKQWSARHAMCGFSFRLRGQRLVLPPMNPARHISTLRQTKGDA